MIWFTLYITYPFFLNIFSPVSPNAPKNLSTMAHHLRWNAIRYFFFCIGSNFSLICSFIWNKFCYSTLSFNKFLNTVYKYFVVTIFSKLKDNCPGYDAHNNKIVGLFMDASTTSKIVPIFDVNWSPCSLPLLIERVTNGICGNLVNLFFLDSCNYVTVIFYK